MFSFLCSEDPETAFVHSLVASSVVYHMIEDCHKGRNKNCPCLSVMKMADSTPPQSPSQPTPQTLCRSDFMYGFKRGKKAIKLLELKKVRGQRKVFNQRNARAGYKVSSWWIICVQMMFLLLSIDKGD